MPQTGKNSLVAPSAPLNLIDVLGKKFSTPAEAADFFNRSGGRSSFEVKGLEILPGWQNVVVKHFGLTYTNANGNESALPSLVMQNSEKKAQQANDVKALAAYVASPFIKDSVVAKITLIKNGKLRRYSDGRSLSHQSNIIVQISDVAELKRGLLMEDKLAMLNLARAAYRTFFTDAPFDEAKEQKVSIASFLDETAPQASDRATKIINFVQEQIAKSKTALTTLTLDDKEIQLNYIHGDLRTEQISYQNGTPFYGFDKELYTLEIFDKKSGVLIHTQVITSKDLFSTNGLNATVDYKSVDVEGILSDTVLMADIQKAIDRGDSAYVLEETYSKYIGMYDIIGKSFEIIGDAKVFEIELSVFKDTALKSGKGYRSGWNTRITKTDVTKLPAAVQKAIGVVTKDDMIAALLKAQPTKNVVIGTYSPEQIKEEYAKLAK